METAMLQFSHPDGEPTLDQVARLFGIPRTALDDDFGVIATDPEAGLYTVLVDTAVGPQVETVLARRPKTDGEGLFSNPRIEPFGPPE